MKITSRKSNKIVNEARKSEQMAAAEACSKHYVALANLNDLQADQDYECCLIEVLRSELLQIEECGDTVVGGEEYHGAALAIISQVLPDSEKLKKARASLEQAKKIESKKVGTSIYLRLLEDAGDSQVQMN